MIFVLLHHACFVLPEQDALRKRLVLDSFTSPGAMWAQYCELALRFRAAMVQSPDSHPAICALYPPRMSREGSGMGRSFDGVAAMDLCLRKVRS
jgi:hypothetical protein